MAKRAVAFRSKPPKFGVLVGQDAQGRDQYVTFRKHVAVVSDPVAIEVLMDKFKESPWLVWPEEGVIICEGCFKVLQTDFALQGHQRSCKEFLALGAPEEEA